MAKTLPKYKPGMSPEDYLDACVEAGFTEDELEALFESEIPQSKDGIVTLTMDVDDKDADGDGDASGDKDKDGDGKKGS